ncbi:uncharacterized protein LOC18431442 isoform X2 [Amborella trichopoda]|uniref:uncharacterized protein LOC18431442 isoform X2 n=1 Tax=Amborella trichopoda TaxID=13333 RepID=UPI0009BE455C|nr:uncharacterized protein LOC18431442 isoform X2 [Amborella trichopoda]|eukprot:XP_020521124.1 uncharacterized protein LOC18431442 isoform X2 [Amborella trichopoda]
MPSVSEEDLPAIRALGHLFRLKEVFLEDDAQDELPHLMVHDASVKFHDLIFQANFSLYTLPDKQTSTKLNVEHLVNDFTASSEDTQLAEEMIALGLPLSFSARRETIALQQKTVAGKGRRKHRQVLSDDTNHKDAQEVSRMSREGGTASPLSFSDGIEEFPTMSLDKIAGNEYDSAEICCNLHNFHGEGICESLSVNGGEDQKFSCKGINGVIASNGMDHDTILACSSEDIGQVAHSSSQCHIQISSGTRILGTNGLICHGKDKEHVEGKQDGFLQKKDKQDGDVYFVNGIAEVDDIDAKREAEQLWNSQSVDCLDPSVSIEHDCQDGDVTCSMDHFNDLGVWRAVWDSYYDRNYFYNIETYETTWYPPLGVEHLASCGVTCDISEMIVDRDDRNFGLENFCKDNQGFEKSSLQDACDCTDGEVQDPKKMFEDSSMCQEVNNSCKEDLHPVPLSALLDSSQATPSDACSEDLWISDLQLQSLSLPEDELDMPKELSHKKKKKTKKGARFLTESFSIDSIRGTGKGQALNVEKYWFQRYQLFSRFDEGVKLDKEGWFSVTPELLAKHHATRCGHGTIIDCFTGVGGNAIQFARKGNHVIGIDIDPQKINYAQHNARVYGVADHIDFVKGNFFHLAPTLKADVVFMSPPWGGPDYAKVQKYDINMLRPYGGTFLFDTARVVASTVVMFLPRNVDLNQVAELSLLASPPWMVEVEKNYVKGKLKGITAYFHDTSL